MRRAIASASPDSSAVHGRASRISHRTSARPPTPLYVPSRSHAGSVGAGSVTASGIQGPSSHRTWSSTHLHAASAVSTYLLCSLTRPMMASRVTTRQADTASEGTYAAPGLPDVLVGSIMMLLTSRADVPGHRPPRVIGSS